MSALMRIPTNTARPRATPRRTRTATSAGAASRTAFTSIAVTSSEDYTIKEKSVRVDVYHDEFEDDKNDKTEYVGTAAKDHADFTATKLRLSIKGYAANISHENNDVVRGDETFEGAELELFAYDSKSKSKTIKSKGKAIATATVGADGLYEFNDLDEGAYVIVAKNTDDYEMYAAGPDVHYLNNKAANTYKDDDVLEEALKLPYWDYESSEVMNMTSAHTVGTGAAAKSFTYYNFALLHGDGEFSGRVVEARGEPDGIAVELRRCETTTLDADDADVVTDCREDTDFDAQTENAAGSSGRWDFPSLREGYYVANIAAATYNQAKWGDDGIDDDAANCIGDATVDADCDDDRTVDMFGMLEGKRAFNRGGATFRVYNRTLGDDAELDGIVIEGTTDAEDGDEELADITPPNHADGTTNSLPAVASAITWASEEITVTPDLSDEKASVRVVVGDLDSSDDEGSGGHGDDITVDLEGGANTVTVIVTAENGYHDRVYSFAVTRTTPVDAELAGLGLRTDRDAEAGSEVSINPAFAPATTEYTATVPTVTTGTGTTMSVYVLATVRMQQQDITVTYSDGGTMTELDALPGRAGDGTNQKVYRVTIPKTGALTDKSVLVKVTGENGTTMLTYDIQLQRGGDVVAPGTASLTALSLSGVTLAFASATTDYTANVESTVDMTTVDATPTNGATARITPADADANTNGHQVNLAVGTTTITIAVTGAGMTPSTYTVMVTRADPSTPTVTLTLDPTSIDEDGGTSTLTATVSPASATAFDVTVTATPGAAVTMSGTMLSFAANATSPTADVTITAVDNEVDAADQTVTISGTTPSGVAAPADVTLTITDDDGTAPTGQQVTLVLDRTRIPEFQGGQHGDGEGVARIADRVHRDGVGGGGKSCR